MRPFQYIAADIFDFNNQPFPLIADQYSKMPFVKTLKSTTSLNCIEYFKAIFAVHGIQTQTMQDILSPTSSTILPQSGNSLTSHQASGTHNQTGS